MRGAREHNLKDVSLDLPRDALIVFTGLSGSGKSSLAFDTIFAEGQRRYVESRVGGERGVRHRRHPGDDAWAREREPVAPAAAVGRRGRAADELGERRERPRAVVPQRQRRVVGDDRRERAERDQREQQPQRRRAQQADRRARRLHAPSPARRAFTRPPRGDRGARAASRRTRTRATWRARRA